MTKEIDRIGEINKSNEGYLMKIIHYYSSKNIIVEFENGYTCGTDYYKFTNGSVINPFHKTSYGVGYLGEGKHYNINKNITINRKIYKTWNSMLNRCYGEIFKNKNTTYINATVCDDWLCYQNFAEWYVNNYYEVEGQIMDLDKDILVKGNKVYSPKNCVFVPHDINSLFIRSNKTRGKFPIGVSWDKTRQKFSSTCNDGHGKTKHLGRFNTSKQAFEKYKVEKELIIKQKAEAYKDKIPKNLYIAMMNYEVEITD